MQLLLDARGGLEGGEVETVAGAAATLADEAEPHVRQPTCFAAHLRCCFCGRLLTAEARWRAQLLFPTALALRRDGSLLYVADRDAHAIRAVALPSGHVSTVTGGVAAAAAGVAGGGGAAHAQQRTARQGGGTSAADGSGQDHAGSATADGGTALGLNGGSALGLNAAASGATAQGDNSRVGGWTHIGSGSDADFEVAAAAHAAAGGVGVVAAGGVGIGASGAGSLSILRGSAGEVGPRPGPTWEAAAVTKEAELRQSQWRPAAAAAVQAAAGAVAAHAAAAAAAGKAAVAAGGEREVEAMKGAAGIASGVLCLLLPRQPGGLLQAC